MNANLKFGYVKIYRAIYKHWISDNHKYFFAWNWLLSHANWENKKTLIGSQLITVKRGEIITSFRKFGEATGMSEDQVRLFWDLLEKDGMISRTSTTRFTQITVRNYDRYQEMPRTDPEQIQNKPRTDPEWIQTTKEVKEGKNVKRKRKKAVPQVDLKTPLPERIQKFRSEINDRIGVKIGKQDAQDFFNYWAEPILGTEVMRWENQDTWNLNMRISKWLRNKKNFGLEKESAINKKKDTGIPGKRTGEMKTMKDLIKRKNETGSEQ